LTVAIAAIAVAGYAVCSGTHELDLKRNSLFVEARATPIQAEMSLPERQF
jgi:hypothetical protein